MSSIKASLLLATFNMPKHLALVCAGLERQTFREFEILFCDDGSGSETKMIIESLSSRVGVPVRHFWQEHRGFRKCRILNQALREARGQTLIFLDGDCVPHCDFVRDHYEQQESGRYLAGRRVELGPEISEWLKPAHIKSGFFDYLHPRLIWSAICGDTEHIQRSVRIPWEGLRKRLGMEHVDDLKGCNYSLSCESLKAINGFDEEYEGYGREDTDIELRLQNLGLRIKSLKGLALQFHVWHQRQVFTSSNEARLKELKLSKRTRCTYGLTKP